MTIDQARSAYDIQEPLEVNELWIHLTLPKVSIADVDMHVDASAKRAGRKVAIVDIWQYFGLKESPPFVTPRQQFDALKTLLLQKYGQNAAEESVREYDNEVVRDRWIFPSTVITLEVSTAPAAPNLGKVHLKYEPSDKKSLEII